MLKVYNAFMDVYYTFHKINSSLIFQSSFKTASNNFHPDESNLAVQFCLKLGLKYIFINTFYKAFCF